MSFNRMIYLDNGETTRVDPLVAKVVDEYMSERFGLPRGEFGYSLEEEASEALEHARRVIADKINAQPYEIVFTSGGTESNNLALKGVAYSKRYSGERIITSKIEHRSILNITDRLSKEGFESILLNVDREGFVSLEQLERSLDDARIISIQHANQEIGTIQDLIEVGRICREHDVVFHSDAVQSFCKEKIDVDKMNIDLLTISSHLIHGPKGVGALYVRKGLELQPLMDGDEREFSLRPGSHNLPGIMGFAKAVELMKDEHILHMKILRDRLIYEVLKIDDTNLNGPKDGRRLCSNVNVTFRFVEGEALLLQADMMGLIVNTGSACFSQKLEPSHVIRAIGGSYEEAHGSTRITLSRWTTEEEVDMAVDILRDVVNRLRAFSPLARRRV